MSRTVHGAYVAIIVSIFYCGFSSSLQINLEDAVTDSVRYDNWSIESVQVVEPFETNKNDVEIMPENDIGLLFTSLNTKRKQNADLQEDTIINEADKMIKQRKTRQASHGHIPLYPQLPSEPTYNLYSPQPSFNPAGQSPYQQQQQPQQWNPNTYNYSQPGNSSPHNFNPNTGYQNLNQGAYNYSKPGYPSNNHNPNQGAYNPFTGQNSYNSHPYYPSHNHTSPGNPYSPRNGQYPSYNQSSNYPPQTGSFRPLNTSGSSLTTAWPPSYPRPGQNYNNNSYPGQPPYNNNNNYPNYPHQSTGNTHPVMSLNSTSQRPPYYNPSQYPSYNNSHPNYSPQYPSAPYSPSPNFPGARPMPSYNMSHGQYPQNFNPQSPYSSNTTSYPKPAQPSPYYPGSSGQYPSNTNTNFNPNYPQTNATTGIKFVNTYNPSIPNYPPQNNNQGQNNFYYPQNQNSQYDPTRVPPQNYSYH